VHHGFALTGYRLAYVPVLLPVFNRFEFRMYRLERNDALADAVAEAGRRFYRDHVEADKQPADFRPPIEVLKRMRRVPNKTVPVSGELLDAWVTARAALKVATEEEEAFKAAVLAELGDAEAGDPGDGRLLTYFEHKRKAYEVPETSYRQLRVKPAKEPR
jgi:hypothetical protein